MREGKAEEREKKQLSEGMRKENVLRTSKMNMRSCADEREQDEERNEELRAVKRTHSYGKRRGQKE